MTNSKTTKRALFSSTVALLLCFTMLLGTTFAWFTDSAASDSNVITAGNLDIIVEYTLGDKDTEGNFIWKDLDGADDLFQKGLWEPGHTEVVALRIKNNGTLALKYAANMNIVDETVGKNADNGDITLSEILTVSTLTIEAAGTDPVLGWDIAAMTLEKAFQGENDIGWGAPVAFNAGNVLESDQSLYVGSTQYVFVKVDMAETVGNEANHNGVKIPTINFGINVLATQFTYENDSFGNQYDKDALYPVVDAEGIADAIAKGKPIKFEADITLTETIAVTGDTYIDLNGYDLDASANASRPFNIDDGASLTINAGDSEIDCGTYGLVNMTEGTLTINGGTFTNEEGNNGAFIKINGDEEMVINLNDVTYKAGTSDSGVLRTSGSNVTVNVVGGTYEAGMGFIIENGSIKGAEITATNTANMWPAVYADGDVTVTGCTIKSACHAIAVGGGNTVTVENCDVQVPEGKLAFQVFSSGGTINVVSCTYPEKSYGTTGKITAGSPDAVINIDGEEVYRKAAQ